MWSRVVGCFFVMCSMFAVISTTKEEDFVFLTLNASILINITYKKREIEEEERSLDSPVLSRVISVNCRRTFRRTIEEPSVKGFV